MKKSGGFKLIILILALCLLVGCTTGTGIDLKKVISATADPNEPRQDPKPFLDQYISLLNEYNFGKCYALLTPDAKE